MREGVKKKKKQICLDLVVLITIYLQASDWRLKCGWIGTKLGELFPHLEYFDLFSWFENCLSRAPYWKGFLVQVTGSFRMEQFW
jgi:hypothetical protein